MARSPFASREASPWRTSAVWSCCASCATPGTSESRRNLWSNLDHLLPHDQLKIVLASRSDYEWACARLAEHALADRCMVLFSPVHGALQPRDLAEWILADQLPVRFQLQLHKLLWNDAPGR